MINSLAVGEYDTAFRSVSGSFMSMLEQTFGLFKPAADTAFVQPLIKYSPHVLRAETTLNWLPFLITICFKVLVVMLIFKLLMGVVMESYKKHKPKDHIASVRDNLADIFVRLRLRIVHREKYVPFMHVALACAHHESQYEEAEEWEREYIGLDSTDSIRDALNELVDGKGVSDELKAIVKKHKFKQVTDEHLKFVLEQYGVSRSKARVTVADAMMAQKKEADDPQTHEASAQLDAIQDEIDKMTSKWIGDVHSVRMFNKEVKKKYHAFTKKVFKHFDFHRMGTIDIRHMSYALKMLGFHMDDAKVGELLNKHDKDGDGSFSLREVDQLSQDLALIGHFHASGDFVNGIDKEYRGLTEEEKESLKGFHRSAFTAQVASLVASDLRTTGTVEKKRLH
jgi:uncharacterized protein YukE